MLFFSLEGFIQDIHERRLAANRVKIFACRVTCVAQVVFIKNRVKVKVKVKVKVRVRVRVRVRVKVRVKVKVRVRVRVSPRPPSGARCARACRR